MMATAKTTNPTGLTSILGRGIRGTLLTPLGVLIVIPTLVLVVGVYSAWNGYQTGYDIGRSMAVAQMDEHTRQAREAIATSTALADQLLMAMDDFLKRCDGDPQGEAYAWWGRDQLCGRPTVAMLNFGRPNGTFQGVGRQPDLGFIYSDRRFQGERAFRKDYRLQPSGTAMDLDLEQDVPRNKGYDPTARPWYRKATSENTTIWTEPYAFFASGITGITCARPWRDAHQQVAGVCAVDFDVNSLAAFAKRFTTVEGGQAFLFTEDDVLLAHPSVQVRPGNDDKGERELYRLTELENPLVDAFAPAWHQQGDGQAFILAVGGITYLVRADACPVADGVTWYFGQAVPEEHFAARARAHVARAAVAGGIVLLAAVLAAIAFAAAIIRVERIARRAKDSLHAARLELRQLGAYRLIEKLGEGGMGEVWLAKHTLLAFPAAVKLIHPRALRGDDDGEDAESLFARFRREALALAGLRSPFTIRLYDFGQSPDGILYYVMELLDGLDLEHLVEQHGTVPPGRVVEILSGVCASLAEAHDLGLVHRDIKPANVYLCRQGDEVDVVKVLDFGMVRRMGIEQDQRLTIEGYVHGTPTFMSPEQIRDAVLTPASDLYAVGCLAYWMLGGRLVFDGPALDVLTAHLHLDPPPLREFAPAEVPDLLCDLVMACLAKNPEDRPEDARELRQRLEALTLPDGGRWNLDLAREWWVDIPSIYDRLDKAETDETVVAQVLERG